MKKILFSVLAIFMVLGPVGIAGAIVLDFDDITTDDQAPFSSYGGLEWENAVAVNTQSAVSGEYALGNYNFPPAASMTLGTFDFSGAYFFTPAGDSTSIQVMAFLEGNLQGTQTTPTIGAAPLRVDFSFTGIDRLVFVPEFGSPFAMDDFTYNASPVPEPATMLLLGTGLIGIAGFRKKFKK